MSTLGWKDKLGMARGLMEFFRGYPAVDDESVEQWLKRTRQTERSVRHFWNPILMATLNDRIAHCSTRYAGKVFHELFIKSSTGGRLGIPTVPLSAFYADTARLIETRDGTVQLRTSVEAITQERDGRWRVRVENQDYVAGSIVLALPFEQTQKLLPAVRLNEQYAGLALDTREELESKMARQVHSPYTSVLLWFDREITDLDHAWLLDTTIEWFFHKSRIRRYPPEKEIGRAHV